MKLAPKKRRFVEEYIIDLDAPNAAIRAGYTKKWATSNAYKLLKITEIQEAIQAELAKRSQRTEITADRVLKEISRLAFVDPRKFFHDDGSPKAITELDDDSAAALAGMDVVNIGNSDVGVGQVMKYKLAEKNKSLDMLCRHLGLYDADKSKKTEIAVNGFRMVVE